MNPPTAHTTPTVEELDGIDPVVYERRWAILATMCLSLVLIVATVSSVNVAIPKLAGSSLNPSSTQILWIVDAYALVFAALLLPAGAIGDRFGRKGALLTGLVIFIIASTACAFMGNATALIACRAIMGIGAALIMPSTLSLLQSAFPRRERAKAIAVWAGFAGAGGAIGPLMGGFLVEHFWYGSVFLVAAPIATVALIASAILAPSSREEADGPLDFGGALLSIVGFGALLAAIIEGPARGWTDPLVLVGFVLAAICLIGFVFFERRQRHPMLDMHFFENSRFAMGSLGITVTFFAMFAMFFVLTQYLQFVQGYSPLEAGVRGLPFAATMIIVSPRAPRLAAGIGTKRAVGGGMLLLAVGLTLMSFVGLQTSYWYVAVCLVLMAAGVGSAMPSLSSGIVQSVPMNKAGVGSAVNDTTREVGGAIGIAALGSIVNSIYRGQLAPALSQLPADAQEVASRNVAGALRVAGSLAVTAGPEAAARFATAVQQSFVDGMHVALRVAAAVVVAGALVVAARIPDGEQHGELHGAAAH
jgi:EmrB/QacA subfamily drug resistance transporter